MSPPRMLQGSAAASREKRASSETAEQLAGAGRRGSACLAAACLWASSCQAAACSHCLSDWLPPCLLWLLLLPSLLPLRLARPSCSSTSDRSSASVLAPPLLSSVKAVYALPSLCRMGPLGGRGGGGRKSTSDTAAPIPSPPVEDTCLRGCSCAACGDDKEEEGPSTSSSDVSAPAPWSPASPVAASSLPAARPIRNILRMEKAATAPGRRVVL